VNAVPEAEAGPRPLSSGAVYSAGAQVVAAIAGALTTVVVARLLGPSGAGSYAVAATLFFMLLTFGTLGLDNGLIYYVSSRLWAPRDAWRRSALVAFTLGLCVAGLGLGAKFIFGSAFQGLSTPLAIATVLSIPFALCWTYGAAVSLARDRYEAYAAAPASQAAIALLFVGIGGAVSGLEGAVVGYALSQVVVAAGVTLYNRRAIPVDPPGVPAGREPLRGAFSFGARAYAANALQFFNYRLDLFILNSVATSAEVGYYSVAIAATTAMWLLPQALSAVIVPRVAALGAAADKDSLEYRELVETKSLRHVTLIMFVSAILLAGALVLLVTIVYGPAFEPAVKLGLILLPGVTLIGIAGIYMATIVGRGFPTYSLIVAVVTTPITIGLYAWLVPEFEGTGAALASSISYTITFVLSAFFYKRVTGRGALAVLVPTRSELADYKVAWHAARARLSSRSS
jgi:O-antigen/teichoic acid export membrane protein